MRSPSALGAVCFVPSWLWADRTLDFLETTSELAGLGVHLGRWAIKNVAFFGVLAGGVLLWGLPRLRRAWSSWPTSVPFRFALFALAVTEVLYFRFPFKMVHLIPAGMAVALLIGHFGIEARRWIGVLIAAQLIGGLITTTLAAPDVEDRASRGQVDLGITTGPLAHRRPVPPRRPRRRPLRRGTVPESMRALRPQRLLPPGDLARHRLIPSRTAGPPCASLAWTGWSVAQVKGAAGRRSGPVGRTAAWGRGTWARTVLWSASQGHWSPQNLWRHLTRRLVTLWTLVASAGLGPDRG